MALCVFFLDLLPAQGSNLNTYSANNIQRVRIDFTMPNGYVRHLMLGFTPDNAATDGVDYGYDALNFDNFPDDLNWMIEGDRYVIQGVGEFNEESQYPLGMFLSNTGTIEIALDALENFENPINVYLYDSELDTYTLINDEAFSGEFSNGEYLDRFSIVFTNPNNENSDDDTILSIHDQTTVIADIKYLRNNNELHISANKIISKIEVFNLLGKKILSKSNIHSNEFRFIVQNQINSPYGLVRIHSLSGTTVTKKIILQ